MDSDVEWRILQDAKEATILRKCVGQIEMILHTDDAVMVRLARIQVEVEAAAAKINELRWGETDE
jgi:hypothetical protein